MGNLQVRFLEGWAPAMAPGHSTLIALRQSCPRSEGNLPAADASSFEKLPDAGAPEWEEAQEQMEHEDRDGTASDRWCSDMDLGPGW
jgi:hypothetical protein